MKVVYLIFFALIVSCSNRLENEQNSAISVVNVFAGTSGDYGQLSPSASSPFGLMSIGPQTSSPNHTGYEYESKNFLGFTHNRIEGVGCKGNGGNLLITPILNGIQKDTLKISDQKGSPGLYEISLSNGIHARVTACNQVAVHSYSSDSNDAIGLAIDLSHSFGLADRQISSFGHVSENIFSGYIQSSTTCSKGAYKLFFAIEGNVDGTFLPSSSFDNWTYIPDKNTSNLELHVSWSSNSEESARNKVRGLTFNEVLKCSESGWNKHLNRIQVTADSTTQAMFYTMLYRVLQSPYVVSDNVNPFITQAKYKNTDSSNLYNGFAIWDNYRTQLPFLSLVYPNEFQDILASIANLYKKGIRQWSGPNEPSPTVRTEHASVVLLDGIKKGYTVRLYDIIDSIDNNIQKLNMDSPDKALEAYYDIWSLSKLYKILGETNKSISAKKRLEGYKELWISEFKNVESEDADIMKARNLYQGTIWQYRWFVPYDTPGLANLIGSTEETVSQLDYFFENSLYNHGNQPDLQVPFLYNSYGKPHKTQALIRKMLLDTTINRYGTHEKFSKPFINKIYRNEPKAFLPEMDDDLGTMSGWYIWASIGLFPDCVGIPRYQIVTPIIKKTSIFIGNKSFNIITDTIDSERPFLSKIVLNGEKLDRYWLSHQEIMNGGTLELFTSDIAPVDN